MYAKYYVAVRPQTNDLHAIHREECPFLPDDGKRIYLGSFKSGNEAVTKGHLHFERTEGCLFCCKENTLSTETQDVLQLADINTGLSGLQIPVSVQQSMFCCLN